MNSRRVSRFDDGESPPKKEYPDWINAETTVSIFKLSEEFTYNDAVEIIETRGDEILEVLTDNPAYSTLVGFAKFRTRKRIER